MSLDNLIKYVKEFNPDFDSQIEGASAAEIAALEEFAGRLPDSYRAFLGRMGHGEDGLDITFGGTTDITEITDHYKKLIVTGIRQMPSNCVLMGIGNFRVEYIYLDASESPNPRVVFTEGGRVSQLYAETLEKLLFRIAFMKFRLKAFEFSAFCSGSNPQSLLNSAKGFAGKMGFAGLEFSDSVTFCGSKTGAAIAINQFEGDGIAVIVGASSETDAQNIAKLFADKFDLSFG
jgi:hypothetical protein